MSRGHKPLLQSKKSMTAAIILLVAAVFLTIWFHEHSLCLTLRNTSDGTLYAAYPMKEGDMFGIGFIHSVNKSPVTDYYQICEGSIYVEKTIYYGFGAGVQTEIEPGQTLTYGEDGSMIVSGFHMKMADLTYFVGTVSDHTLTMDGRDPISLRDLCGRNAHVRFQYERLGFLEMIGAYISR